jgi:hypothetical protein
MRNAMFAVVALVGLSLVTERAAALEITQEQADGACQGQKDGNGDTACAKCGTINDRSCKYVVVYQCGGGKCTTTVYRMGGRSGRPTATPVKSSTAR